MLKKLNHKDLQEKLYCIPFFVVFVVHLLTAPCLDLPGSVNTVGARRILTAAGLPEKPLADIRRENVTAHGVEGESIDWARNWTMKNVRLFTSDGLPVKATNSQDVALSEAILEQQPPAHQDAKK